MPPAPLHLHDDPDGGEVRLYCYSEDRAKKERGIAERFAFEQDLKALHEGLSRPGTQKRRPHLAAHRIREKSRGAGHEVKVDLNETGQRAVACTSPDSPCHPPRGVLRSNRLERGAAAYTLLTDRVPRSERQRAICSLPSSPTSSCRSSARRWASAPTAS